MRYGHRGLHRACVETWIERNAATPEDAHKIPAIAVPQAKYDSALQVGTLQLEKVCREIQETDDDLHHVIFSYHSHLLRELKGKPEPVHREWVCPQEQALASKPDLAEGLRSDVKEAIQCLDRVLEQMDRLSMRTIPYIEPRLASARLATAAATKKLSQVSAIVNSAVYRGDKVIHIHRYT